MILRNVWGWLHAEVTAQPWRGALNLRPDSLCLDRLLIWLVSEIAKTYRLLRNELAYDDLHERVQALGIIFNYGL